MALTVDSKGSPVKVTGTTATSSAVLTSAAFITHMYWYNPTTAGDLLTVVDRAGREIAVFRCETASFSQVLPILHLYQKVNITDMDSGTLYIYVL